MTTNHILFQMQILDVLPAVIGNVFARAVAHEWQASSGGNHNGGGPITYQNGSGISTAVSSSISSSKGKIQ